MIQRIDMFMPPISQYGVLQHFTRKFHDALIRAGVKSNLLIAERENPKPFLESLFGDRPECTLSFNGLLPDEKGVFFCDLIRIPHVACLVDSPVHFLPLTGSPLSIITCPDRDFCDFFRGLKFENVLFMPHGVEKSLTTEIENHREYDVVMFASCIDYEQIRESWKEKFSPVLCKVMDEACEMTLSDQNISYLNAFVQAVDRQVKEKGDIDSKNINLILALAEIEGYIKGKDRVELIRGIKDANVHVFGAPSKTAPWENYFGDSYPNVTVHDPLPYEEVIEVMKKSKIVLNSCPWSKNGVHERIFAGIACGAAVITNGNRYIQKHFTDGDDIVFYQHGRWDKVNDHLNALLSDDAKRRTFVNKARAIVKENHTWDHRVQTLLQELPPILKRLPLPKT